MNEWTWDWSAFWYSIASLGCLYAVAGGWAYELSRGKRTPARENKGLVALSATCYGSIGLMFTVVYAFKHDNLTTNITMLGGLAITAATLVTADVVRRRRSTTNARAQGVQDGS